MQDGGEVRAISAPLTHTTTAVFGSSEVAGVDGHKPPLAGPHEGAVCWTVVGKRASVGYVNRLFIKLFVSMSVKYFFSHISVSGPLMHSQLLGGVVGMRSLRTKIPFGTDCRLISMRSTV